MKWYLASLAIGGIAGLCLAQGDNELKNRKWSVHLKMRDYRDAANAQGKIYTDCAKILQARLTNPKAGRDIFGEPKDAVLEGKAESAFDRMLSIQNEWTSYAITNTPYVAIEQQKELQTFTHICNEICEARNRYAEYLAEYLKERREDKKLDLMRRQTEAQESQADALRRLGYEFDKLNRNH